MRQIYFLSIVINLIAGIVLARAIVAGKFPSFGKFLEDIEGLSPFRLIGGVAAAAVGILKLLMVSAGDVLVVGDLFPALAGIAAGAALLSLCYQERAASAPPSRMSRAADFLASNKQIWGIAAAAAAVLHFFFYRALFL